MSCCEFSEELVRDNGKLCAIAMEGVAEAAEFGRRYQRRRKHDVEMTQSPYLYHTVYSSGSHGGSARGSRQQDALKESFLVLRIFCWPRQNSFHDIRFRSSMGACSQTFILLDRRHSFRISWTMLVVAGPRPGNFRTVLRNPGVECFPSC